MRTNLLPSSINNDRIAHGHKFLSSAGLVLDHNTLGTTPNIAPPSNLKYPVSIVYNFMLVNFNQSKVIKLNYMIHLNYKFYFK